MEDEGWFVGAVEEVEGWDEAEDASAGRRGHGSSRCGWLGCYFWLQRQLKVWVLRKKHRSKAPW